MRSSPESMGNPNKKFTNWAGTFSCNPELYFEPETEEDIKQILDWAREKDKKVKVVGCGHSPSDVACTTDYMINMKRMNKVVDVNENSCQITVQAGCSLTDLNHTILPKHDMAFSVQGSVCDLTAGGVISTGTHGTGVNFGIISSYVLKLRLMKASGEVVNITKASDPELFSAAAVSLGALGVILEVTFQCEKAFRLHQRQYPDTLTNVLSKVDERRKSSDHFRFMWYPHTDSVVCYEATRTTEKPSAKGSWFWDMLIGFHVLQFFLWLSTFANFLVPIITKVHFWLYCSTPCEKVDRSDLIFNFNCLFRQYVTEWAIPSDKTAQVLTELNNWIQKSGFPAHFPVEVRFVKEDDIALSPCYKQESCYINIIMYRPYNKFVSFERYWEAYEAIMAKYGGRPHWAKAHKYTGSDLQKVYPKWDDFCAMRQKLDPNGMFLNTYLEKIFNMKNSSISNGV